MTDKPFTPRAIDAAAKTPLDDDAFAALMARLGPFEAAPHLAVGVSGGADSLSLALLADTWARARGGRMTALIVDHGLRAESGLEARDVRARLVERGLEADVLKWQGPKPATGIQAAARTARFSLMGDWLGRRGVLHLLLGHHRDDQAETFLLRLDAGSGIDGLAAMAPVSERRGYRVLRPFLHVPKAQLVATVTKQKMRWIEDPSNKNPAFARVRVRGALHEGPGGLDAPPIGKLANLTRRIGAVRADLEGETWTALADVVNVHPAGFAVLNLGRLRALPERLALRVLGRSVMCVGGRDHTPRTEKTERLLDRLLSDETVLGRTLGGCRLSPLGRRTPFPVNGKGLLICRENRNLPGAHAALPGQVLLWDNRFDLTLKANPAGRGAAWVAPLGRDGWRAIAALAPGLKRCDLPVQVRPGLPALWDEAGVVAVPHLGFLRINHNPGTDMPGVCLEKARFCPPQSLGGHGFCLASGQ